jgi:hypothetical protein
VVPPTSTHAAPPVPATPTEAGRGGLHLHLGPSRPPLSRIPTIQATSSTVKGYMKGRYTKLIAHSLNPKFPSIHVPLTPPLMTQSLTLPPPPTQISASSVHPPVATISPLLIQKGSKQFSSQNLSSPSLTTPQHTRQHLHSSSLGQPQVSSSQTQVQRTT